MIHSKLTFSNKVKDLGQGCCWRWVFLPMSNYSHYSYCKVHISFIESLRSFVKNQVDILVWVYFWVLRVSPLVYASVPPPMPRHHDHCHYRQWDHCIEWLLPLYPFLFFSTIVLVILGPLPRHTNFIMRLSMSTKNC